MKEKKRLSVDYWEKEGKGKGKEVHIIQKTVISIILLRLLW